MNEADKALYQQATGKEWAYDFDPHVAEKFAELVRADEREQCAKVCDKQIKVYLSPQYSTGQPFSSFKERFAAAGCAEAIRARGNT